MLAGLALSLAIAATCAPPAPAASPRPPQAQPPAPPLDAAQRSWLRAHATWTVGMTRGGWPPYETWRGGQPAGLSYDYLSIIASRLGARLHVHLYDSWPNLQAAACRGDVDVVMSMAITVPRTRCLAFSRPYQVSRVVMVARTRAIAGLRSQAHPLRVAVETGHAINELLPESYPGAQATRVADTPAALAALRDGRVDAYFGNAYAVDALLRESPDAGLHIVGPARLPPNALHFASPNDRRLLVEAIDQAMDTLTPAERQAIDARWLDPRFAWTTNVLQLSEHERAWLRDLPVLRVAFDPTWAPLTPRGADGQMSGVLGDYLQRMQSQLGIRIEPVPARDWRQARALIQSGQADIAPAVGQAGYGRAWHQTQPLVTFPGVIVTRRRAPVVADLDDLANRRIAVSDPDLGRHLSRLLPGTPQVQVASDGEGLRLVDRGRADAYVGNLASVDNSLRELQSSELRVAAPAGFSDEIGLAVRDPYAPLAELFDRVARDIGDGERQAIRKRWLQVDYDYGFARPLVLWSSAAALAIIVLLGAAYTRLRAEIAGRREADARLRDIARNLPAVVFKLRLSPAGALHFVHVTGNPQPLFALDAAQIMQDHRRLFDRVDPADHLAMTAALEESARTLQPMVRDFRSHGAQGWRWTSLNIVPRRTEDGAVHWSGYWADATAIHEQNAALERARAAAVAAATAKSDFLAVMSHEIRTPMAGLSGMLELLARTPLGCEQRQLLSTSIESAAALRQILDDILDFSKAEAGQVRLESIEMDLRQIVGGVLEVLGPAARQKGLAVRLALAPTLAARHLGDPFRLRQVLLNLVGNAIKFTPRGHVEVAVEASEEADHDATGAIAVQHIRLRVADTGVGIPRPQQARLFRPFVQADATTTRHYGGTGLGLSICRQLVELMQGQVTLESNEGIGTCVEVDLTLPVFRWLAPDPLLVGRVVALDIEDPAQHAQVVAMLAAFGIDAPQPNGPLPDAWITDRVPPRSPPGETVLLCAHGDIAGHASEYRAYHDPLLPGALQTVLQNLLDPARHETPARPPISPSWPVAPLLVVEDHPTSRMLITRQLEALGYPCLVTSDGAEALATLDQYPVSLVLTDISMPHMDGHALAARIRAGEAPGTRLPILAMTANVLADSHDDVRIDAWLHKPIDLQALEAALARWLPGAPVPSSARPPVVHDDPALVRSFLETTRADLDALAQALQRRDAIGCARRLHRMAGALGHFGQAGLAIEARDLEARLHGHAAVPATVARQIDDLLGRLRLACEEVSARQARPGADAGA